MKAMQCTSSVVVGEAKRGVEKDSATRKERLSRRSVAVSKTEAEDSFVPTNTTILPSSVTAALKSMNVRASTKGEDDIKPHQSAPVTTIQTKDVHEGVVKWSRGAIGWVVCAALQAKFPDQDVFVHKRKCAGEVMPRQGETVSFTLMCDEKGRPQAARAWQFAEPKMVSAKDWFAERARRM